MTNATRTPVSYREYLRAMVDKGRGLSVVLQLWDEMRSRTGIWTRLADDFQAPDPYLEYRQEYAYWDMQEFPSTSYSAAFGQRASGTVTGHMPTSAPTEFQTVPWHPSSRDLNLEHRLIGPASWLGRLRIPSNRSTTK